MKHIIYAEGDKERISWTIHTNDSVIKQSREHVEIYKNKVTKVQSKYIAIHIGLFWAIGTFVIKNKDTVKIKLNEKIMYDHFMGYSKPKDDLIKNRLKFIRQIMAQRDLKVEFELTN